MNDKIERLKRVTTFSMLPDKILQELESQMSFQSYEKGEILFRIGDPGDSLLIIDRGLVRVYLEISDNPLTLQELGPGHAIGEMALIDGNPRSANVVALEKTHVWRLDREIFMTAVRDRSELATALLFELSSNLRFATLFIQKAAEWSQAVAGAQYDKAMEALEEAQSKEGDRIDDFLRAFRLMVTEVQAREEAYRREVQELRILIDEVKRDRQVTAIESSVTFQKIAEQGRSLREERQRRSKPSSD